MSQRYHGKSSAPLPPHVYKVAERAHDCMLSTQTSQCCVISGESGAGKTETCKYLIQHLVFIAGSDESNLNSKISQVCSGYHSMLEHHMNVQYITGMSQVCSRYHRYVQNVTYVQDFTGMFNVSQVCSRYRYVKDITESQVCMKKTRYTGMTNVVWSYR